VAHTKKQKVTLKGKELTVLDIPQAESVAEAVSMWGEADVLKLVNRQFATDQMNLARREATPASSKKRLRAIAASMIPKDVLQALIATTEPLKVQEAFNKLVDDYIPAAEEAVSNGTVSLDEVLA
jgi:hypothetical protein